MNTTKGGIMTVLYHKKLPKMQLDEGYIGITDDLDVRNEQHERDAHILNSPYTVHNMMRIHKGQYYTEILDEGTRKAMSDKEYKLRPHWHIAWNMAPGGGNLGGWRNISKWLDEYLYNTKTMESIRVLTYNSPSALAKDIFNKSSNSPRIAELLTGKRVEYMDWQLQNAQVVQRVKERLTISYPYYIKEIEKDIVYKVYRNGWGELSIDNNIDKEHASWNKIFKKVQDTIYGYELANEDMYNLNPGKIYGSES